MKAHIYFDTETEGNNECTPGIDVPKGATELGYFFQEANGNVCTAYARIPIPRPKRKVKKWISFFKDAHGRLCINGSGMEPRLFNSKYEAEGCGRISAVEIEVEE